MASKRVGAAFQGTERSHVVPVSLDLGRRLLASGALPAAGVYQATLVFLRTGRPLVRTLVEGGFVSQGFLEQGLPAGSDPPLEVVVASQPIVRRLPAGLCEALYALPIGQDAQGLVEIAAVDPLDGHTRDEFAFHLRSPVRLVRARLSAVEAALSNLPSLDADRTDHDCGDETPRPPFKPIEPYLAAITVATRRDEIIDLLLSGLKTVASRVAVFAARREGYRGLSCSPGVAALSEFRELLLPAVPSSILSRAFDSGPYLGAIAETQPDRRFRDLIGKTDEEVLVAPIRVAGLPALALFADRIGDTLAATQRARELGRVTEIALVRLLRAQKRDCRL